MWGLLLGAAVLCLPQSVLAQDSGSKAVTVNGKAGAVAARAPKPKPKPALPRAKVSGSLWSLVSRYR